MIDYYSSLTILKKKNMISFQYDRNLYRNDLHHAAESITMFDDDRILK